MDPILDRRLFDAKIENYHCKSAEYEESIELMQAMHPLGSLPAFAEFYEKDDRNRVPNSKLDLTLTNTELQSIEIE